MAKDAYWFPHDSNASNDPKIVAMKSKYKSEGYGWYWILIEAMRESDHYKLEIAPYTFDALAVQMLCKKEQVETFIEECVNSFCLFVKEGCFIWSESLMRRMEAKDHISEKRRQAALKKHSNANALQNPANALQVSAIRIEENRREENKVNNKLFTEPLLQEVVDFFKSKESSPVEGELFFHHYQSKGWMVGRNKMKNWQSAASGWITRGKTQPQIFGSNNGQPQDGSGDPRRDPSTKRIQIFS